VAGFPIVGPIVGLKYYFQDMNILPFLIIQKDNTRTHYASSQTHIGTGTTPATSTKSRIDNQLAIIQEISSFIEC
jgi:hypothetical protein